MDMRHDHPRQCRCGCELAGGPDEITTRSKMVVTVSHGRHAHCDANSCQTASLCLPLFTLRRWAGVCGAPLENVFDRKPDQVAREFAARLVRHEAVRPIV